MSPQAVGVSLPIIGREFGLGSAIPSATRGLIAGLMVFVALLLTLEGTACSLLLGIKPLPRRRGARAISSGVRPPDRRYHAVFDFVFFQVLTTVVVRATLLAATAPEPPQPAHMIAGSVMDPNVATVTPDHKHAGACAGMFSCN